MKGGSTIQAGESYKNSDNDKPENPVLLFGSTNNIKELKDDESNLPFFEEEDEYGGGIELCAHQPTFVNLDSLVPRGYGSLLELPKSTIETPSTTIPQSQNSVLPSESLSQMKLRNKDKWSEIGYDPNHGKGNLKCSYTLSQFRPSSLLGNINANNDKKENPMTIKEEDENANKQAKENKKGQTRINSSEGHRKKYAMSDSDEEEKKEKQEEENENEEEQKPFGDISMLLAQPLIQNNETENEEVEEVEEIEEEEEEEDNEKNEEINNPVLLFGSTNNIKELKNEDSNKPGDEEEDEYGGGIELCAHQPTFINLDSLVPRGYGSLLELPKSTIETPSTTIPQNQNQNSVLPSESLSQMKLRNKDKWSEIGYDPNHGKGNLKCSYTLSQFRPSSLLGNINANNDKKENPMTIKEEEENVVKKEETDDKKETKKGKTRINSSEGRRKKYAMSDSDEEEKEEKQEEENENEEEQKPFGDISMLLAQPLIQNNETENEEVEEIEEEEEEAEEEEEKEKENNIGVIYEENENEKKNDNKESQNKESQNKESNNDENKKNSSELQNSAKDKDKSNIKSKNEKKKSSRNKPTNSKEEAQKSHDKTGQNNQTYNDRYNMFLTQIQEKKIQRTTRSDDEDIVIKKKDPSQTRERQLKKTYGVENQFYKKKLVQTKRSSSSIVSSSPKIYQPFPSYRPKPPLDLSPYDDENFDAEQNKSKIPPKLLEMVSHSPKSIVFRALCGEDVSSYSKKVLNQVISDLKGYLQKCVKNDLIGESSYVDCIINNIKVDIQNSNKLKKKDDQIDEKIGQAETSIEDRKQHWKEKKDILEVERDLALEDLDLKQQEDVQSLEEKWNSEKMQSKYNKPSKKLLELRQNARALIAAHKFEEAQVLAEQVAEQEAFETNQALAKMQREYQQAQEHLSQKYETDRKAMYDSFESKLNGIKQSETSDLHPFEQRIDNLQKMKKSMEISKKKMNGISSSNPQKKTPISVKTPPLSLNAKLKLPPLKSAAQSKKSDGKVCVPKK